MAKCHVRFTFPRGADFLNGPAQHIGRYGVRLVASDYNQDDGYCIADLVGPETALKKAMAFFENVDGLTTE